MMNKKILFLLIGFFSFFGCYKPTIPWQVTASSIVDTGQHVRAAVNWKGGPDGTPINITVIYELNIDENQTNWQPIARHDNWKNVQSIDFSEDGSFVVLAADSKNRDIWIWEIGKLPVEFTSNKDIEGDVTLIEDSVIFRKKEGKAHNLFVKSLNGLDNKRLTDGSSTRWNLKASEGEEGVVLLHNVRSGMNIGLSAIGIDGSRPQRVFDEDGPEVSFDISANDVIFSNENNWFLCSSKAGMDFSNSVCVKNDAPSAFGWIGDVFIINQDVYGGIVADESSPNANILLYIFDNQIYEFAYENNVIKHVQSEGDKLSLRINNPMFGDFFAILKIGEFELEELPVIYAPESDN